jgi:hypothetical protein
MASTLSIGRLDFADDDDNPYPGAWMGMANDVEGNTRWLRLGGLADDASRLSLQSDRVHVSGRLGIGVTNPGAPLDVAGDVNIRGRLTVTGDHNLLKTWSAQAVCTNSGADRAGSWKIDYSGQFSSVYTAFVILQGFSIWNPGSVAAFWAGGRHARGDNAIPQHCWARVDGFNTYEAYGQTYCSESVAGNEGDNSVLFSLVVLGRP